MDRTHAHTGNVQQSVGIGHRFGCAYQATEGGSDTPGYKAEHATDLETGAIIAASIPPQTARRPRIAWKLREGILFRRRCPRTTKTDMTMTTAMLRAAATAPTGTAAQPEVMDKCDDKTELLEYLEAVGPASLHLRAPAA